MASLAYRPRTPEGEVLHALVRDHFETFLARTVERRDGQRLPAFVEREFREFLTCGSLAGGFARFRCSACGFDRLVAFSCKGRGFCPSCGGRRMTERAAHLVDRVLPAVPIRQWVLTLPPRLRYLLAGDHALCRAIVAVFLRGVGGWLRARARRCGVRDARWGAVAIVQRFGSALNLNVHIHALVLDGVYARDRAGRLRFHRGRDARLGDFDALLGCIARRIQRVLARRGLACGGDAGDAPDPWAEEAPVLAGLSAASVQGVAALGRRAGASVRRWGDGIDLPASPGLSSWHAHRDGFNLHAGIRVRARARDRLERLCRYALRPAVGQTRLQAMPDGTVVLELNRRWRDGTTHLVFEPIELLERLAALVPRPRINLVLYHGLLAPRARWRREIVPTGPGGAAGTANAVHAKQARDRVPNSTWAALMQRGFGFDMLACPRCRGRLRLVALIHAPPVIERILQHLGMPAVAPVMLPARDPPRQNVDQHLLAVAD